MKLITKFWLRIICRYRQIIWHYTAIWIGTIRRHKKHCSDIMMSAMASQITGVSIVCLTVWLRRRSKNKKENVKAPRHWPPWGEPPVTGGLPPQRGSNADIISVDVLVMQRSMVRERVPLTQSDRFIPLLTYGMLNRVGHCYTSSTNILISILTAITTDITFEKLNLITLLKTFLYTNVVSHLSWFSCAVLNCDDLTTWSK